MTSIRAIQKIKDIKIISNEIKFTKCAVDVYCQEYGIKSTYLILNPFNTVLLNLILPFGLIFDLDSLLLNVFSNLTFLKKIHELNHKYLLTG